VTGVLPTPLASTQDPHAQRNKRKRRALAAAAIALMIAGCSNAPAGSGATSDGGNANAAHEQAILFAECMRDNGVSDFPDPDPSGTLTIETVANGTSIDTDSASFQRAITACKDLEPAGFTGFARTPEQQQAALEFAQCIRDNGVRDFPDPAEDEPLVDTNRIPSSTTEGGMSVLNAAMQTCGDLAEEAIGR
jgi:hypothetical protein